MTSMSIDPIEHVLKKYYRSYNCQSLSISVWYLGTSAYVPRGPRPLPQRFEVPTPHSEIRVSQYQVPMILRVKRLSALSFSLGPNPAEQVSCNSMQLQSVGRT